jgi:hypothetical protein
MLTISGGGEGKKRTAKRIPQKQDVLLKFPSVLQNLFSLKEQWFLGEACLF